jgi:hypothetical protein
MKMNQLKKMLFGLAVIALPVLIAAPAMAQGVQFQSSSLSRQVRIEGRTEAVGEITLLTALGGTVLAGSSITIAYPADITNILTAPTPDTAGTMACITNPAGPVTCVAADVVPSAANNQVVLSFINANTTFSPGGTITVSGIRVDISEIGASGAANAILSGTSFNPVTNPITFTNPVVQVANIQDPALDISFLPGAVPQTILTCQAQSITSTSLTQVPGTATFQIRATEEFPVAATSQLDETGFAGVPAPTAGTTIRVTMTGVPDGYTITPQASTTSGGFPLLVTTLPGPQESTGGALTFNYIVGSGAINTLTGAIERIIFNYIVQATRNSVALLGGEPSVVEATVSLETVDTGTTPSTTISFAANVQDAATVLIFNDCQTFLLFSWLPNTDDGSYDAGFTVSNTTADPPVIGTEGQTGDVTLYLWRTDGTALAPITLAEDLGPGETVTGVMSELVDGPFLGYGIVVCNFQFGHGFAFINNPSPGTGGAFAQGYQALSIFNPRLLGAVAGFESSGH